MIRITVAMVALLATTDAQAAPRQTPESIVRGVYDGFIKQNDQFAPPYQPSESFYSPHLKALVAAARKAAAGEAPCGLDFNFWVDGQDYDVKSVDLTEATGPNARSETVTAKFISLREPHEIRLSFVKIAGRWRLDDAAETLGKGWVFSKLLACQS
jgi:hypothetical protein